MTRQHRPHQRTPENDPAPAPAHVMQKVSVEAQQIDLDVTLAERTEFASPAAHATGYTDLLPSS